MPSQIGLGVGEEDPNLVVDFPTEVEAVAGTASLQPHPVNDASDPNLSSDGPQAKNALLRNLRKRKAVEPISNLEKENLCAGAPVHLDEYGPCEVQPAGGFVSAAASIGADTTHCQPACGT